MSIKPIKHNNMTINANRSYRTIVPVSQRAPRLVRLFKLLRRGKVGRVGAQAFVLPLCTARWGLAPVTISPSSLAIALED